MKLSGRSLKRLREVINGDADSPGPVYRSGPTLVALFNEFGSDDVYSMGGGFPSRWAYTDEHLKRLNDTPEMKRLIETALDPLECASPEDLKPALEHLNPALERDGYRLAITGGRTVVLTTDGAPVEPEALANYPAASGPYVHEQMTKCREKLASGDFSGAITNARTLVEKVLMDVEETLGGPNPYDGHLPKLQKRVHLLLADGREPELEEVKQFLRGLETVASGLAGTSNKLGDRHPEKVPAKRHHAKLAINTAFALADFYVEALNGRLDSKRR